MEIPIKFIRGRSWWFMLTVEWLRGENIQDISEVVVSVTWEGSTSQVARTADIVVLHAPDDQNIVDLNLQIGVGDVIRLQENEIIFIGQVITKEMKSETGSITYSCIDFLNHLLKSTGVYNFSNTTAEQITKEVCADFEITVRMIAETGVPIKKMILDGNNIYDIIMMAYTKAAKQTGEKYICRMIGTDLTVEVKGKKVENFVLSDEVNLTDVNVSETIENMVNVVKIYDDAGKQVGEVTEDEWIGKYGIYQQIYKKEKGINETIAAKNLLCGIEETISLSAISGNLHCIAGNAVEVYDSATGLRGLFWIESDSHIWENGIHTMNLDLNFQNIMDSKEYEEEEGNI